MIVLDTHVLVWWLTQAPGLSTAARRAIGKFSSAGEVVASTISVLEIATAVRRGRLQFSVPVDQWLADVRSVPELRLELRQTLAQGGDVDLGHGRLLHVQMRST